MKSWRSKDQILKNIELAILSAKERKEQFIYYCLEDVFQTEEFKFVCPFLDRKGFNNLLYRDTVGNLYLYISWKSL